MSHIWILDFNRNPLSLDYLSHNASFQVGWTERELLFLGQREQDPLPESLGSGHQKYVAITGIRDAPWMYTHPRKKAKKIKLHFKHNKLSSKWWGLFVDICLSNIYTPNIHSNFLF